MSAPEGFQKGSFRGVAFRTEESETSGGRRGVVHEFPQAEKPVWEDMGRAARSYRIDCHIVGDDYPAVANDLADALDAPGAGTLIHPWFGSMQVAVPAGAWSRRDSAIDGVNIAWFSIDFVETGLPAPAVATADTQAEAIAQADIAAEAAPSLFGDAFSIEGATAFVEAAAGDVIDGAATLVSLRAGLQGGFGGALQALQTNLGLLGEAGDLLRAPIALGVAVVSLVQVLGAIGGSAEGDSYRALMDWGSDLPAVIGDTPARVLERENQAAIVQLVNLAASAELVRWLAGSDFASYDDAVVARDDAADRLDALALRQADAGDDDGADQYDALRRACTADLTARGGSLARLQSFTPAVTEPALVIAMRLYGDPTTVIDRADEIVARNKVRHPGFVPGGAALQVLSREAING
ncbi:DNA circularization protein [Sphingobium yanoikuyae]|uniref:DNA circularization protein n=1 Tax=Sphingobium yanoikuyae TaxID=13690 RepID=UPI0026F1D2D3|nr:DNA circularization N-terminal domain-containing protein [Sphingobium yanoikuyae]